MNVSFDAETLVEQLVESNEPPYLLVGMADAEGRHYLILQRAQPFDGPGDWGVYVEVDGQGSSGYDGISSCELSPERMSVRMKKSLGRADAVESVEVRFRPDRRPSRALITRLRAIFTGRESLLRVLDGGAAA